MAITLNDSSMIVRMNILLILLALGPLACHQTIYTAKAQSASFSFGLIADCQYCQVEGTGTRKYSLSDTKLKSCVEHLNTMDLAYTIHLGDFIDRDWESFQVVNPIYQQLKMPGYHVLGNHDFSVADHRKSEVREHMGMPANYYDFKVNDWRFIVLDGNDISFHAYPTESKQYQFARDYYEQNKIDSPKWNGAIGEQQITWLKQTLKKASNKGEKVALFCHFPVYPANVHNLWNAAEIIDILESYPVVKAYINGHNHEGNYGWKNGIHYLTLKGMVDTEESSYGVVQVLKDRFELLGFGRENNRTLHFEKALGQAQSEDESKQDSSIKVMTYNIWNGFDWGKDSVRRTQLQEWVDSQKPDVVALQELCKYTSEKLAEDATSWGHAYSVLLKTSGYSVGLTSSHPIELKEKLREGLHHGALHCQTQGIDFLVVHLHPGSIKRRREESRILLKKLAEIAQSTPNYVVLGDFNAHSPFDASLYEPEGAFMSRLFNNHRDKGLEGNMDHDRLDFAVMSSFLSIPLYDVVEKYSHGMKERGSFPGRILGRVNHESGEELQARLERIDYIMVSASMRDKCRRAKVHNGEANWFLSDHYPVSAVFSRPE